MIRAVLFDLYGVLGLNGWQDFKHQHFSGRWELWEPLRKLGQRVDAGEVSDDAFVDAIAAATGETPEKVRYQFDHTQPNRELLDFIRTELEGKYKIALMSNSSSDVRHGIFSADDQALFDVVVMSVFEGLTKPDPAMFRLAAERLGVTPSECLMIDDQARHLEAATSLGMQTVLYTSAADAIAQIRERLRP